MNIIINNSQKADLFAMLFQHIKVFTEYINIVIDKDKMYIQSMDNSRVSIFEINLPAEWFDEFIFSHNTNIVLGVSSSIMYRILNSRDKNQLIQLIYLSNDLDKLIINYTGENKTEFEKHFEIPLIEIDSDMLVIPEVDYQTEFSVSSSNFSSIINQLKMFGDTMDIHCSEEKIQLSSYSQEHGKMVVEIKIDDLTSFSINEDEKINLSFSLTYLHHICLYNKLAKEIELKISSDFPMKIIYLLGRNDEAKMSFFLAPKINDDE
jgi:proliferating cell nuclear antigen